MKSVALREVAEFINGVAFKPEDWHDSGLPIIRIQNLTDPTKPINVTTREVHDKYRVRRGDILVSWSATLGVFTWDRTDEALVNQHIFRVLPKESVVERDYLKHILQGALASMEQHLHGATMKHVNRGEFLATEIPLPPLDEQRRIAAILGETDWLYGVTVRRLDYLEKLSQSVFAKLVGRGEEVALGDIIEVRSSLVDPTTAENQALPHVGPDSIKSGGSRIEGWRTVAEDGVTSGKYEFKTGDVLYSKIRPNLNKVAVARFDGLCSADMYAIKAIDSRATTEFIEFSLRSPQFLSYAEGLSNRANIPKLNRKQLEAFPVAVPSLDDQHQFTEMLSAIRRCVDQVELSTARVLELRESLHARAFSGQL